MQTLHPTNDFIIQNTLLKDTMIIVIPLGGIGERFKQNGYTLPKGLIKVLGKPILYYLLDCLMQTPKSPIQRCSYGQETSFEDMHDKSGIGDFGDWSH